MAGAWPSRTRRSSNSAPPALRRSTPRSRSCSARSSSASAARSSSSRPRTSPGRASSRPSAACRRTSTPRAIPGKRYYGGCDVVDEIEQTAIDRAKALFGAEHANVQPHAGAQTNMAVYMAVLQPGDTILSLELSHGGHLTHGLKVNFSGRLYAIAHYGVSRETNMVDYDDVLELAKEHKPKLIVCGGSAYPRTVETDKFREIADEVDALLLCDMAHFAGLVAAGLHPNPVEHCDFVTSTTHKTLAGPARRVHPLPRGARPGRGPRRLPGHAGRSAHAHDRGQGRLLQDRRHRGVPRLPEPGAVRMPTCSPRRSRSRV